MDSTVDLEFLLFPAKVAACRLDSLESQAVFTVMLEAIARPGLLCSLPDDIVGRLPSVLAPLLVLADVETTVHIVEAASFTWQDAVTSSTGARSTRVEEADLIAIPAESAEHIASILGLARPGTAFSPESAARLVIGVRDIRSHVSASHADVTLVLRGPGIEDERVVCIDGVTEADLGTWARSRSRFPAGVDVWFATEGGRIVGVPRSTHVDIVATWSPQEGD